MASINELKEVLKETLEDRGVLQEVKARIRAEIFNTLNERPTKKPELSNENLIINELIREYLVFNNYTHALAVLLPESGQPELPPFDRDFIMKKLGLIENQESKELPLLYSLAFGLKKMIPKDLAGQQQDLAMREQIEQTKFSRFPHQQQILEKDGNNLLDNESRAVYQDIFSVDNPKPMMYSKKI